MKKIIIGLFLITCIISLNSCKKKITGCTDSAATNYNSKANESDGSCTYAPKYTIGQSYQGGYIAYFLKQGDPGYDANVQHGLIAAPYDQSTGIQWYNGTHTITGATATAFGTGNANTNTIVTSQGVGSYAAKLCSDLVLGGYSDWYLPSRDELNSFYINRVGVGGFANYGYWSSSEYDYFGAWRQDFSDGYQNNGSDKANVAYVRAVRAF